MTKDRRLGRGLAALLGSPLDEDGVIDGSSVSPGTAAGASSAGVPAPTGPRPSVSRPAVSRTEAAASKTGGGSHANSSSPPPKATAGSGGPPRPAAGGGSNAASVTGTVPLKNSTSAPSGSTSLELSVYEIDNNPFQPRRKFSEEEIAALAESIREHQQLQPVLVRRVGERYQLISGERRLRATIHAGLKTIRAEVREADDRLVAELAIVENLQRKDLDAIEKALSFRRYIDEHKCTQEDLAKRLKIDRSTIANLMRLLELPASIQQWIQGDKLTAGHARALLPLGEESQQLGFARSIIDEGWSVRETERRVSEQLAKEDGQVAGSTESRKRGKRTTPQLVSLEQQLRLALGAKTEIRQTATGRGKIVISFTNADEFERLYALICPQQSKKAA